MNVNERIKLIREKFCGGNNIMFAQKKGLCDRNKRVSYHQQVQRGDNNEYIKAYRSNTKTYPDGKLIHEPQDIAWKYIREIFLVLGYVVKKGGGTILFSNKNK
jgi:uncharacterized protein (DUF779 family)